MVLEEWEIRHLATSLATFSTTFIRPSIFHQSSKPIDWWKPASSWSSSKSFILGSSLPFIFRITESCLPSMQFVEPIILLLIIFSISLRTLSHDSSASSLSSFLSSFERNFGEDSPAAASSTLSCIQVLNSKCPGVRSDSSLSLILAGSSSIDLVLLSFLS